MAIIHFWVLPSIIVESLSEWVLSGFISTIAKLAYGQGGSLISVFETLPLKSV